MVDTNPRNAFVDSLREMVKVCSACGASLSNHSLAAFALTVAPEQKKGRLLEFFESLEAHDWHRALQFQEFDPQLNAVHAWALKCPSGAIIVLMVDDPYLPPENSVMDLEVLDSESGKELESLIESDEWRKM